MLLRYADKRIVNVVKLYIERNNLHLELIRYRTFFYFIHVYFFEMTDSMQYRTHIRKFRTQSVSDSLGRLAATSPCMACKLNSVY